MFFPIHILNNILGFLVLLTIATLLQSTQARDADLDGVIHNKYKRNPPMDTNHPNAWKLMHIQVCQSENFTGHCRYYDTNVDDCVDLSRSYDGKGIGSVRSLTALGNCQLFTTPTCTLLPNQRNMMVYYGLGGMSHTRGMTEGEIKSMKCFIEGKPTSMVDYNEDD